MKNNVEKQEMKENNTQLLKDLATKSKDLEKAEKLADEMVGQVKKLTDIGIDLSAEKDTVKLLEMIVDGAILFTKSDGATLYMVSPDGKSLDFELVQSISLGVRMGGSSGKITWPAVKLINEDGSDNHSNVSAYVALTGKTVSIPDVYDAEGFDFKGTRDFDKKNNYRSKSMLVIPLRDHEDEIIGVLQLINAHSVLDKAIIPFSADGQSIILSLASQAAIAITKNRLIQELENLFDAFIKTIAAAIDEKSPYTGGHIKRVSDITLMIAGKINEKKEGCYSDVSFGEDALNELRVAAWMHDIGKITTPEYVVDKSTKLETIYDRINEVQTRFEVFKRDVEIRFLKKKIALLEKSEVKDEHVSQYETEYGSELKKVEEEFEFINTVNTGGEFLADEKIEKIKEIAGNTYLTNEKPLPWLSENEVYNLSIKKGTLTKEEREKIQNHVRLTKVMLNKLPFSKKLKKVPAIASAHHETLKGTGYPDGLKGDQISLEARILAFADIFEALSDSDRPYKKGKTATEVKKIMGFMVKDEHVDKDVFDLFFTEGLFQEYAKKEYKPDQIDMDM